MTIQPISNKTKLDALFRYKSELECLTQFACSEDLNLIEALTANLLVYLEMELHKCKVLYNKERRERREV